MSTTKAFQVSEVVHATFDPEGPDVVRLHLVPPKKKPDKNPWVLFINGWDIILLGPSWAILLKSFIEALWKHSTPGQEISKADQESIRLQTAISMKALYPQTNINNFLEDLNEIMEIIYAIAHGEEIPQDAIPTTTMADYAKLMGAPHRMDLIVSAMIKDGKYNCPLHCKACYAMGQPMMRVERELSTREWKMIIDRCWQAGIPQLTFTGGEPLMRDDIVEMVAYAHKHVTRLNTNGVRLTTQLAQKLFQASLDGIQITLYSHNSDTHDQLVGKKGAWQQTVQGIKNAIAAGLMVSINTPLVFSNSDYSTTLHFLHNLGVRYVTCSGLIPTGGANNQISSKKILSNEILFDVLKKAVQTCYELGMEISFTSPGWLSPDQLKSLGLTYPTCGACTSNMAIAPNGQVVPCQSWLHDSQAGFGHMLEEDWTKIWNHRIARKLRHTSRTDCPLSEVK